MQLERIALHLRPRNAWEALDLGLAMNAAWRGPALRAWLATYWLTGLVLMAVLNSHLDIALIVLWWLKPAFDRVVLHVHSRALFGETTSIRQVWRAIPDLLRRPGLLSSLSLRRLSLARSFLLPVWQLEQQRGNASRQRFRLLAARQRGQAAWLTFFCSNASTILWVSGIIVLEMLMPQGYSLFDWGDWLKSEQTQPTQLVAAVIYMAAETLIEPYYVAAGFALYLNRRSELEGWDIELAFRHLSARKAGEALGRATLQVLLPLLTCGLLAVLLLAPQPGYAGQDSPATPAGESAATPVDRPANMPDTSPDSSPGSSPDSSPDAPSGAAPATAAAENCAQPPSRARREIDAVLADPVFGKQVEDTRWQWIDDTSAQTRPDRGMPGWMKTLAALVNGLSAVLKVAVGLIALAALGFLLWLLWRTRGRWQPALRRAPPPEVLFGLDVRPQSLPDDIAAAALAEADPARALSLLYRGALVALIHHHQAEFREGDTEADCLRRSRPHLADAGQAYFAELLGAWQLTAYAATPPTAEAMRALCLAWPTHFAAPRAATGT